MNIIQINANENGGRPPMQSLHGAPPAGYALVPDTLDTSVFYNFMGFVTLELDGSTVTAMTGNQEALDDYKASDQEKRVAALEAASDRLDAQATYTAMMTDTLMEG